MGAAAVFQGPEADRLVKKYFALLQMSGMYDVYTVVVNGVVQVWKVTPDSAIPLSENATIIELPTHLVGKHDKLLAALTVGEEHVFATAMTVNKTLGSDHGKVY